MNEEKKGIGVGWIALFVAGALAAAGGGYYYLRKKESDKPNKPSPEKSNKLAQDKPDTSKIVLPPNTSKGSTGIAVVPKP